MQDNTNFLRLLTLISFLRTQHKRLPIFFPHFSYLNLNLETFKITEILIELNIDFFRQYFLTSEKDIYTLTVMFYVIYLMFHLYVPLGWLSPGEPIVFLPTSTANQLRTKWTLNRRLKHFSGRRPPEISTRSS